MEKTTTIIQQSPNYVKWSNSYSVKIKMIDDQHKGLLDIVNDLFNHASGNEAAETAYFKGVIQQAVQYIKDHFQTEEKIMVAIKFPGYAEHKKKHDGFTLTVVKSVKDFESGKRLVLEKFAYFLKDWVLTHIAVMDTQYVPYFQKMITRKAEGKPALPRADADKTTQ